MKLSVPLGQLSFVAESNENSGVENVLEQVLSYGIKSIDVSAEDLDKYGVSYIKKLHEAYGIDSSAMCELLDFKYKESDILKENSKRQLERCSEINCPIFMPVPVVREKLENENARIDALKMTVEYLNDTSEISKQYGITTTVENFSSTNTPISLISDISYILEQLPYVKYVFDSGNFWFGGTDMLKACRKFAEHTVFVHLKDIKENKEGCLKVNGRCADSVAIGEGELPIFEALNVLKTAGYKGAFQVEINNLDSQMMSRIETSVNNLKKIM